MVGTIYPPPSRLHRAQGLELVPESAPNLESLARSGSESTEMALKWPGMAWYKYNLVELVIFLGIISIIISLRYV